MQNSKVLIVGSKFIDKSKILEKFKNESVIFENLEPNYKINEMATAAEMKHIITTPYEHPQCFIVDGTLEAFTNSTIRLFSTVINAEELF